MIHQASRAVDQSRCAVADVSTRPHLLVDDVVIRFDIQLDSFRVSTSSWKIRNESMIGRLKLDTA